MAFDTLTPDGRTLQIGTVHNLGRNFAHAFDIQFETETGSHEYVYQSCFGISERVLAALISVHGDDRGLILPPEVAPIQVVIVPIYYKEKEKNVREASEQVLSIIRKTGIRVQFDDRDELTPGAKYYYHELRGVPIRIEIGPRDVKENKVTLVRRDTLNKEQVSMNSMIERVQQLMDEITETMKTTAEQKFKERIFSAQNLEEVKEILSSRSGIVEVSWCGDEGCAQELEEEIQGSILGTPVTEKKIAVSECIVCQKPGEVVVRIARAY
jgi:prolyl-tRNA synthetase